MVQKNGYFQVEFIDDGAICHVYPPEDDGTRVEYRTITAFLDAHGFTYNAKELNNAIFAKDPADFNLNPTSTHEFSGTMYVEVDSSKMAATCTFQMESANGQKLTVKDIMAGLQQKGVIFGIDQQAIMDYIANPVYNQDVIMAKGQPPVEGHDAYIEYYFNTDPNTKPAYNDDGSVDFHQLDVISQVEKDQLLARLFLEDRGTSGRNVLGQETAPRTVKSDYIQAGRNIRFNDERTEAYSEVTGHAKMYNGQIFVSDVYEVPADVDNSTGDIEYNGNVYVKGSIREGFQVKAKGDVIVEGTVEGALVMAGGQIVIKRGVNGMNKGVLQAEGNVISKFIENAKVFSGGYIESGSIIHSAVSAKGDVVVNDKKGFITGSVVRSGGKVEAQTIGSAMGSATKIEIGMDPATKEKYVKLEQEIQRINAENKKITPIIQSYKSQIAAGATLDPKNKEYYIKLKQILISNKEGLEGKMNEYEDLRQQIENSVDAKVIVSRDIFAGVTVISGDASLTLREKRSYCYLEKNGGEIVIQNL